MKRTEIFLIVVIMGLLIYLFNSNTTDTSEIDRLRNEFNELKIQRDNFKIERDSMYLLIEKNDSIISLKDSLINIIEKELVKSNTKRDSIKANLTNIKSTNLPANELVEKLREKL